MTQLDSALQKPARIGWIDSLKGICMVTIVMIHIPGEPEVIARLTMPFMLVGFFFVAGVTFGLKSDFASFVKAKFLRLAFPVFAFGILNTIFSIPFKNFDLAERLSGVFFQIPGQWDDMWFVACLFVMELLYYPIERFIVKSWQKFLISLSVCAVGILWTVFIGKPLPWHVINAMLFLPFLSAGKILASEGIIRSMDKEIGHRVYLVFMAVAVYCALVLVVRNWPVDMHVLKFGNPFLYALSAVTGLLGVIGISIVCDKPIFKYLKRIFIFIGANTLVFYGMQSKVISLFDVVFNKLNQKLSLDAYWIWLMVLICVIPVLALLTLIVNRWFPFMTGDFKKVRPKK